jgi:hypothetical protein
VSYIEEVDKNKGSKAKEQKESFRLPLTNLNYVKSTSNKKPEAVFKIVSNGSNSNVKNLLKYISRSEKGENEKLEMEDQDGLLHKGKDGVRDVYSEWKSDFEERKINGTKKPTKLMLFYLERSIKTTGHIDKENFSQVQDALTERFGESMPSNLKSNMHRYSKPRNVRHTTHIVLSAQCDNTPKNQKKVNDAAREFLKERFGKDGFEYVFTTHDDTKHPHTHVIVKNKNKETNKKLRLDPVDLLYLRTEYAKSLEKNGLDHKATRRLDRPDTLEKITKGLEQVRESVKRYDGQLEKRQRVNVGAKQVMLEKQLANLKKDVLDGVFKVTDKSKVLKEIRQLGKNIQIDKNHSSSVVIDSTINMVSKETKELIDKTIKLNEKATPEKDRADRARRAEERKNKRESVARVGSNKIKEIDRAILHIRSLKGADPIAQNFAIDTLNRNKSIIHHLTMTNAKSVYQPKDSGKERER